MRGNGTIKKGVRPASFLVALFVLGGSGADLHAQAAQSKEFKSQGAVTVSMRTMEHADKSSTQLFEAEQVMRIIEGDFAGQTASGTCWGMGTVGADRVYSGRIRCTYRLNESDTYTIQIDDDSEAGGTYDVTGGSGAFAGVSGSGSYTYTYTWGDTVSGTKLTWDGQTSFKLP